MQEPGLDRHDWETEWSDLEDRMADDPVDALSELDGLVARMLQARGHALSERDGETETEPEVVREFQEARRITRAIDAGEDIGPGDVAFAINSYRELYEGLIERGPG